MVMSKLFRQWLFLLFVGLTILGCRQTAKKNDYPVIYNAWNARYQYNPLTREMQPVLDNQTMGRAWSRDEFGRLNSMYFFSGVNGRDEDLFHIHKVNLDKKRDRQWEDEREARISQIREQIALRESNETDQSQQVVKAVPEEDDNADMDAFIPISNVEFTLPDASPPSSDIPGTPLDASFEGAVEEPSPFTPLPALP